MIIKIGYTPFDEQEMDEVDKMIIDGMWESRFGLRGKYWKRKKKNKRVLIFENVHWLNSEIRQMHER